MPRAVRDEHLRLLAPGRTYKTVIENLSRLVRAGLSVAEAAYIVIGHAGLSRFPSPPAGNPPAGRRANTVH